MFAQVENNLVQVTKPKLFEPNEFKAFQCYVYRENTGETHIWPLNMQKCCLNS